MSTKEELIKAGELHAKEFLGTIGREHNLVNLGDALVKAASKDTAVRGDIDEIVAWLAAPQAKVSTKEIEDEVFPILYLRALNQLRKAPPLTTAALRRRVGRAKTMLKKLEPNFTDALLRQARAQKEKDTDFASDLKRARRELGRAIPDFGRQAADLLGSRNAGRPAAPKASCSINGQAASCLLVVAIVVVVIILKA
jgi:hypothetical protein